VGFSVMGAWMGVTPCLNKLALSKFPRS